LERAKKGTDDEEKLRERTTGSGEPVVATGQIFALENGQHQREIGVLPPAQKRGLVESLKEDGGER